jgi:hypothetical protein
VDFDAIKAALKALFATLAGIPALWRDEPRPFVKGPYVLLNVIAGVELGVDEVRRTNLDENGAPTDDPDAAESIAVEACGLRRFTVSVQPETLSQTTGTALGYAERIRARLSLPSSLATLAAAGLALVRVGGSQMLDYVHDNRAYSRASVDVFLAAASNESDAAIGFIETILLTTQVADEAGNVLPSPPNLIDEELPT